jgi:hypothetical protein
MFCGHEPIIECSYSTHWRCSIAGDTSDLRFIGTRIGGASGTTTEAFYRRCIHAAETETKADADTTAAEEATAQTAAFITRSASESASDQTTFDV